MRAFSHTHLQHSLHGRRGVLVTAEVDDDPGDVAEEGDGDRRVDERQQRLDHAQGDDVVPALWAITWTGEGWGGVGGVNATLNTLIQKFI